VYAYLTLLKKAERYEEIIRQCRVALENDPLDERLQLELLQALTKTGRSDEAAMQYRTCPACTFPIWATKRWRRRRTFTGRYPGGGYAGHQPGYHPRGADGLQRLPRRLRVRVRHLPRNLQPAGSNLERLGSSIFLAVVMLSGTEAGRSRRRS
jgi:hypothetical protein